jgi:hypothetical protein
MSNDEDLDDHDSGIDEDEDIDSSASQLSTTPSVLSMDQQISNPYDFSLREMANASPHPYEYTGNKERLLNRCGLPHASSSLSINTAHNPYDKGVWGFDSVYKDPVLYALREPPLPSPEAGRMFHLSRFDVGSTSYQQPQQPSAFLRPRSPTVYAPGNSAAGPRKYSVADLNELLLSSDSPSQSM